MEPRWGETTSLMCWSASHRLRTPMPGCGEDPKIQVWSQVRDHGVGTPLGRLPNRELSWNEPLLSLTCSQFGSSSCIVPRLGRIICCVWSNPRQSLSTHDDGIWQCLCTILHISPDMSPDTRERSELAPCPWRCWVAQTVCP